MAQTMVSNGSVLRPQSSVSKHFSCVNLLNSLTPFRQFSYEKILLWICSVSSNVTTNGSAVLDMSINNSTGRIARSLFNQAGRRIGARPFDRYVTDSSPTFS